MTHLSGFKGRARLYIGWPIYYNIRKNENKKPFWKNQKWTCPKMKKARNFLKKALQKGSSKHNAANSDFLIQ